MSRITGGESQVVNERIYEAFCDPSTLTRLRRNSNVGLMNDLGTLYEFVAQDLRLIDFIAPSIKIDRDNANLEMYNSVNSTEIYRNFLTWLFATFEQDEQQFRSAMLDRLSLSDGMKVLVTGCGLGEDLPMILSAVGAKGEIHAQDISKAMVVSASKRCDQPNVCFSISNALALPYTSRYFDVVFHFGGINLFGDIRRAIGEMERVCKIGGNVLFGDEGISPHLIGTQYADIAINNNHLWAAEAPLKFLPHNAQDINLSYVLGNCFYLIKFSPSNGYPNMNIDVTHKGTRGGTARTRFFGQLEGVTEKSKRKVLNQAKQRGISVHSLLEEIINSSIRDV